MVTITISSRAEELDRLLDFIKMGLEVYQCSIAIWLHLSEVVDDIYINIIRYAFPLEEGLIKVSMNYISEQNAVEISFFDEGIPYNPLESRLTTASNSYNNRLLREQTAVVMKEYIDEASYVYLNSKNVTTIKKYMN